MCVCVVACACVRQTDRAVGICGGTRGRSVWGVPVRKRDTCGVCRVAVEACSSTPTIPHAILPTGMSCVRDKVVMRVPGRGVVVCLCVLRCKPRRHTAMSFSLTPGACWLLGFSAEPRHMTAPVVPPSLARTWHTAVCICICVCVNHAVAVNTLGRQSNSFAKSASITERTTTVALQLPVCGIIAAV
jgi:hypothetical protein